MPSDELHLECSASSAANTAAPAVTAADTELHALVPPPVVSARSWRAPSRRAKLAWALGSTLVVGGVVALLAYTGWAKQPAGSVQDRTLQLTGQIRTRKPHPHRDPNLFCYSVMQIGGVEEDLVKEQLVKRASIFSCDEYAVISTKKVALGNVSWGTVWTWVNQMPKMKKGKYGVNGQTTSSFLNTQVFLMAWNTLISSGRVWRHDFVVKVDPDAVFFPDRLRLQVRKFIGKRVYVTNCGKYRAPLLYGAIEVVSWRAMKVYYHGEKKCRTNLPWHGWGEDMYLQKCMDYLGVHGVSDADEVGDDRCIGAPCTDFTKAAFHPFKTKSSWFHCWAQATGIETEWQFKK